MYSLQLNLFMQCSCYDPTEGWSNYVKDSQLVQKKAGGQGSPTPALQPFSVLAGCLLHNYSSRLLGRSNCIA